MAAIYHQTFILLLFTLLPLLFICTRISRSRRRSGTLPPGPWQLPILGSIHHLLGSQMPHCALQKLAQKYGPIMHMRLGEISTVVISSPEVARQVFTTHDITFSDRPQMTSGKVLSYGFKDLILCAYGEHWRQLRKICVLELFSNRRVESFQFIREEEVLNLVRSIYSANGTPINLSKMLYSLTNDITTRAIMGNMRNRNQEAYLKLLNEAIELASGFSLADLYPSWPLVGWISGTRVKLLRCHRDIDRILEDIIEEHKQMRREIGSIKLAAPVKEADLLDVLLNIQEEGDNSDDQFQLSDDCLKSLIFDIFGAGSETSANTMEWAMTQLVRNPKVMKKVQSEVREMIGKNGKVGQEAVCQMKYLKLVVKETMRLHMPAPLLVPRECRETCQVLGYEIPAKTRVIINAWAMGRDPQYWDDAEEFKPERFDGSQIDFRGANFEYMPFGAGRRMCPGMSFGLASIELALANLIYYFDWKLPDGGSPCDIDIEGSFGVTVRKKSNLILCAIPRVASPAT